MRLTAKTAIMAGIVASSVVLGSNKLEAMKLASEPSLKSSLSRGTDTPNKLKDLSPIEKTSRRPLTSYLNDLKVAQSIVRDKPNSAQGYGTVGICYYQIWLYHTGSPFDMNMAIRAFRTMNSLDKNDPRGHLVISQIFHHAREFKKELKELSSAIERTPRDPELYWYRSELYETMGRKKEALRDKRTAKRLEREFR